MIYIYMYRVFFVLPYNVLLAVCHRSLTLFPSPLCQVQPRPGGAV